MNLRVIQVALLTLLAACGSSPSASAGQSSTDGPFVVSEVTTFDSPWAMSFLPGSATALVTEKPGHLWLVEVNSGRKQAVAGPPGVVAEGQGGLLDVMVSPHFATDGLVYLTFSEPSANGGSQLALARARLLRDPSGARLDGLEVIWHNQTGGQGGHFGARIAFAPDGNSLFLSAGDRQRFTPAQDPNLPMGKVLHLTLEGKPAAGNPGAGRGGAAMVRVTDPPEDSAVAKKAPSRTVTWTGPNLTPAETWTSGHRNPLGLAFAPTPEDQSRGRADSSGQEKSHSESADRDDRQIGAELPRDVGRLADLLTQAVGRSGKLLALDLDVVANLVDSA